uniref:Uncharacterized protein n=1 Tax=Anguilla anguilla TaxID=7936 RepID=A0A0E9QA59_ANGAN
MKSTCESLLLVLVQREIKRRLYFTSLRRNKRNRTSAPECCPEIEVTGGPVSLDA